MVSSPPMIPMSRVQGLLSTLPKLQLDCLGPPTKFTCFPQLATELRIKIWRYASHNEPRTLRLSNSIALRHPQPDAPGVLGACAESRHEALAFYKPCTERTDTESRTVYVNFDIDRFLHKINHYYLVLPSDIHNFDSSSIDSIKYLTFGLDSNWRNPYCNRSQGRLADLELIEWGLLPQLQDLVYLVESEYQFIPDVRYLSNRYKREKDEVVDDLGEDLNHLMREEAERHFFHKNLGDRREAPPKKIKFGVVWRDYRELDLVPTSAD
ncbi:hypothetical protein EG329_005847 [Mollisiaceae sp. DMI_Dod_QoI]|nr:hypothetical protein EG329_005847 [Helotiales sp. DMI_Dod_QoI]